MANEVSLKDLYEAKGLIMAKLRNVDLSSKEGITITMNLERVERAIQVREQAEAELEETRRNNEALLKEQKRGRWMNAGIGIFRTLLSVAASFALAAGVMSFEQEGTLTGKSGNLLMDSIKKGFTIKD